MNAKKQLQEAVDAALLTLEIPADVPREFLQVVPATSAQFGDYQFNGALPLAKTLRQKPRDIAAQLLEKLDVSAICEPPEIAGAGFLNFRLKRQWLETKIAYGAPLMIPATPRKFVVDFSSPNVAKPMHVGHIRSTIIGDAIARMLRFCGHETVRDNHIGDWGTAFGKIIVGWKAELNRENLARDPIGEMERLYQSVNSRPELEDAARLETAKLQAGDSQNMEIWQSVRELSQAQFEAIYAQLGIEFDVTLGESFYNSRLSTLVDELLEAGVARESEGAVAIFSDGKSDPKNDSFLVSRDGQWVDFPAIVRKRDGAATYATTDLATLEYRLQTWAPDEIVYVTDSRQSGHFRQVFAAFERWKGTSPAKLTHVGFGMILGDDRTPFKTRSGATVKLQDLLDEAIERATQILLRESPQIAPETAQELGKIVGIGAVKYADLSQNRASDYVFSWDKMLSLSGNSAVYLLYAYVRTQSVLRKGGVFAKPEISLEDEAEIALAKGLLRFVESVENALDGYRPHVLCDYLYELSSLFSAFWRDCPVLNSPSPLRDSRLRLVEITGETLKTGLGLLGIETVEQL